MSGALETIAVYFTPLVATKVAAYLGFGIAYHAAVVYTNAGGQSFGASAGPSRLSAPTTPGHAFDAILASRTNRPSAFGTLVSDPQNNHAFRKGHPEDYYTQDDLGDAYPHVVVAQGRDLSAAWQKIVATYAKSGRLNLTYSPLSQNSNSVAGTALRHAGIAIPFSSASRFAPAAFNDLLKARVAR